MHDEADVTTEAAEAPDAEAQPADAGPAESSHDDDTEDAERRGETYHVLGEELLSKVREIVREGNVRRLLIRNEKGRTLIEIPLSLGVVGAVLLPIWAAVGAIAALVTKCSIDVERYEDSEE